MKNQRRKLVGKLPVTREEIKEFIILGEDLSRLDTSEITDMSYMFRNSSIQSDISNWNTSNVEDMKYMFTYSDMQSDISRWDVSKVKDVTCMFKGSKISEEQRPTFIL